MKTFQLLLIVIVVIGIVAVVWATALQSPTSPDEEVFVTYDNASADDILIELPFPGAIVGKQFSVIGTARGPWYFEASFPIQLTKPDGTLLAQGIAQAQGEWMTEEFVPFKADFMVLDASYIGPAVLTLQKDNPSGLPQYDASVSFPIVVEY